MYRLGRVGGVCSRKDEDEGLQTKQTAMWTGHLRQQLQLVSHCRSQLHGLLSVGCASAIPLGYPYRPSAAAVLTLTFVLLCNNSNQQQTFSSSCVMCPMMPSMRAELSLNVVDSVSSSLGSTTLLARAVCMCLAGGPAQFTNCSRLVAERTLLAFAAPVRSNMAGRTMLEGCCCC
jgi:hypothetical protein